MNNNITEINDALRTRPPNPRQRLSEEDTTPLAPDIIWNSLVKAETANLAFWQLQRALLDSTIFDRDFGLPHTPLEKLKSVIQKKKRTRLPNPRQRLSEEDTTPLAPDIIWNSLVKVETVNLAFWQLQRACSTAHSLTVMLGCLTSQ